MSLAVLATEENWQGFDDAWTRLIADGGPIDDLIEALDIVGRKRRMARCMGTVRDHADNLSSNDRADDAARLLGAALVGGGAPGELVEPLFQHAETAWGGEPWWDDFCEIAEFRRETTDLRRAWKYFDHLRAYKVGDVIFHASGWGTGEVTEIDTSALEVAITFQSGRKDRFPLRTALEIFERLPENDLRSQSLHDPKGLKERLKKEPIEILKAILARYGGKANSITLRNTLMQVGVTGSAWTSWWKKTRMLAQNSEWFKVTGNATKAEVQLLRRAADPVESMRRQLHHATTLKEVLTRVRDLMSGANLDEAVRIAGLETLDEIAAQPGHELEHRFGAWMLLRDARGETPEALTERLKAAAEEEEPTDPSVPPAIWRLFQRIPGSREQEKTVALLEEIYGDAWADEACKHLPHAPPGAVGPMLEALLEKGCEGDLARHYASLLARPLRAPFVLIGLTKLGESGAFSGDLPTPVQRAQALIELAVFLQEARRGNPLMARAQQRLTDVLVKGDEPLMKRLLADADVDSLKSVRAMLQREVDDQLDSVITDVLLEMNPELFSAKDQPFWAEEDRIWTTRAGLQRRDAELKELRDKKLPENAEALARAASYGDLSENSEWENAIEEQRQLTEQASLIEGELRIAELLENAPIPDDTVCPGTVVRYQEVGSSEDHEIVLLGPWDNDPENAISYRAPLAQGMLGLHPGDQTTIQLPKGEVEVKILGVSPASVG